jgi:hypothetical protein
MSVDDWVQGRAEVFLRLTLLLELVQRPGPDDATHSEAAAAAAAAADMDAGCSFTTDAAAGQNAAAGASNGTAGDDSVASLGSAAMQELQEVVDNWLRMTALSLVFAPDAYMASISISIQDSHGQACPATKQFWAQVTARTQFSDLQLRMLIAARKEFQRLNSVAVASLPDMPNHGACTALFEAVLMRQQQQGAPLNRVQQQQQQGAPQNRVQQQQQGAAGLVLP